MENASNALFCSAPGEKKISSHVFDFMLMESSSKKLDFNRPPRSDDLKQEVHEGYPRTILPVKKRIVNNIASVSPNVLYASCNSFFFA